MTTRSELHRFLFENLAVRGAVVRLTSDWQEVLSRRQANAQTGAFAQPVNQLLGEMSAAALLMQSSLKFTGSLVLQVMGDGPVKLAVAESTAGADGSNLSFRCTAKVTGDVAADARFDSLIVADGRCAITLDPSNRQPGQPAYQGVVPLTDVNGNVHTSLAKVLEHYMLQSEQLETRLVLAANAECAAGLLIQRMPREGARNLGPVDDSTQSTTDFEHVAALLASVQAGELLSTEPLELMHRLFWNELVLRHPPATTSFACTCTRTRVAAMLQGLGVGEVESIIAEHRVVEVGCDFCGANYRFDAVDAAQLFTPNSTTVPGSDQIQ